MVVGAGIVWWPSARSTVLKKLTSGDRDAAAAVPRDPEPETPRSAVLFGDAVVLFDGRVGDEPHPTSGVREGL